MCVCVCLCVCVCVCVVCVCVCVCVCVRQPNSYKDGYLDTVDSQVEQSERQVNKVKYMYTNTHR